MCASVCQSCSISLDYDYDLGTNDDGSKNREYCNRCYRKGEFVNPKLTLKEEIDIITLYIMSTKKMSRHDALLLAENTLSKLRRWIK